MTKDTGLKQLKVFVTEEHMEMAREYGRQHGILAETGRHIGQPHLSAVVRLAIERLADCNGNSKEKETL